MSVQYVGEVVTVVAFLWVDIEEEGLVARGDTGERKKERKRSRKSMGGKEDFIFGGWLEVRSFSIPPSPPCSSSFSFSSFSFSSFFFYSFGCSFFRTTFKDSFEGTSDTRNRLIL